MLTALMAAVVPVLLGALVAIIPGLKGLDVRRIRVVAAVAALVVVVLVLIPEAWEGLGVVALLVVAAATAFPALVERVGRALGREMEVHEFALVGLLGHQVLDGFEVGAAFASIEARWAVAGAVAAHSIPLVGAVLLGVAARRGLSVAAVRAFALVVATGLGVVAASAVVSTGVIEGLLPAVAGGLLLHVFWHELSHRVSEVEHSPLRLGTHCDDCASEHPAAEADPGPAPQG